MSRTNTRHSGGVQSELDDLQRKYRMLEGSRKTYSEDSHNTVRMQRQQIVKLRKDNDRLKEDLALETRQARTISTMSVSDQISKLQDQADSYSRKIGNERRKIAELEKNIEKMQKTILTQRIEMGGINAAKEKNDQVQKQIRILENRLDKALVKFNEALAHNKQLRETIDNLRRERGVFDGIYKKLERELLEKKTKMASIIEISNKAYEARDMAQAEMLALKEQADREQQDFEEKWAQMGHLMEKDRGIKDFIKDRARSGKSYSGGGGEGNGDDGNNEKPGEEEEEKKLRKQVTKGAYAIAKDKAAIQLAMEKVKSYEEAFAKIQKATGISNIDDLVQGFISAEDHNFSLFNHVNDLSNEIEKMEEQLAEVQLELHNFEGASGESSDTQRKQILESLEKKLEKTRNDANFYNGKHTEALETVTSLKDGIASIFSKIGCEELPEAESLGSTGVTETNMMKYLGLIEQRTQELLELYREQRQQQSDQLDDEFVATTTTFTDNNNNSSSVVVVDNQQQEEEEDVVIKTTSKHDQQEEDDEEEIDENHNNNSNDGPTIELPTTTTYNDDDDDDDDDDVVPITNEEINNMVKSHSIASIQ